MHPRIRAGLAGPLTAFLALGLLSSACQSAAPDVQDEPSPTASAAEASPIAEDPASTPAPAGSTLESVTLELEARPDAAVDSTACSALRLDPEGRVELPNCDAAQGALELGPGVRPEWQAIQARLAAFTLETETERLRFEGRGEIASEAWQRALLAWATLRRAELSSGRASASSATAMSWFPAAEPDEAGACPHLTVLAYGYAYAERRDCQSGALVDGLGDWLSDDELDQLDAWLYEHAPYQVDDDYIDGRGETPIGEPEAIEPWATALYDRLRAGGTPIAAGQPDPAAVPEACPSPAEGQALLLAPELGLCALVPSSHSVFSPSPGRRVVARGSLLDVSAPRLELSASPAEGRDAAAAADAILAELAGFTPERSAVELGDPAASPSAVLLDGLPGQDLSRLLLFVAGDQLYELRFSPADHPEMEAFYTLVTRSLRSFAPEG